MSLKYKRKLKSRISWNIKTLQEVIDCQNLWNVNNGTTLCIPCHEKTDNYGNNLIKAKKL